MRATSNEKKEEVFEWLQKKMKVKKDDGKRITYEYIRGKCGIGSQTLDDFKKEFKKKQDEEYSTIVNEQSKLTIENNIV